MTPRPLRPPARHPWPAPRALAGRPARRLGTLLAASAEARALLEAARTLDARLEVGLAQPAPEAVARLRLAVARQIARSPLPASPGLWSRLRVLLRPAVPAGWGALAAMATCALWLSLSAAPAIGDPLAPLQTLPIAEDPL